MFKRKKFIIAAALVAVVLAATVSGVAVAANGEDDPPRLAQTELMDKVAEIYQQNTGTALDAEALQEAFVQARQEIGTQAREQMEQRLIDEGIVTQEQLDAFKAWMQARPDSAISDEFQAWLESRPDVDIPGLGMGQLGPGNGNAGLGPRHGFGGGQGGPPEEPPAD